MSATGKTGLASGAAQVPSWLVTAGIVAALIGLGVGVNLHYAGRGFMPLDQSVVFDGGWRILSGQIPYRDYTPRTGLVPSLFQACFFAVFGVTWFAYCLHAAVFNGLFCVLAYMLLRILAVTKAWAFAWAALTAVVFYPPSGTPYVENHGFFFVMCLLVALVGVRDVSSHRLRRIAWAVMPLGWLLVFLSKQNVAAFAIPSIMIAGIYSARRPAELRVAVRWITLGAALCLAGLVAIVIGLDIGFGVLWGDLFREAAETGAGRFSSAQLGERARGMFWGPRPVASVIAGALAAVFLVKVTVSLGDPARRRRALELLLAASLMILSLVFILTTANQPYNGLPYLFVCLGIVFSRLEFLFPRNEKAGLVMAGRVVILLLSAWLVHRFSEINAQRRFHDMTFEPVSAVQPETVGLRFMRLQALPSEPDPVKGLDDAISFLRTRDRSFFLLGDSSILYGLTEKPSVSPQLFFHSLMRPGVFTPARRRHYEEQLSERFERYDVGFIVLEGEKTFTEVQLSSLPSLHRFVRERSGRVHHFGRFQVVELP